MNNLKSSNSCCAIIVSYEPNLEVLLKLLSQLNSETDFVVIDNASSKIDSFNSSLLGFQRCQKIFSLTKNIGLAAALNIGIKWCFKYKYDYVFLFDQDSSLCRDYIKKMLSAYRDASMIASRKIAVLGPRIVNPVTNSKIKFKTFNKLFFRSERPFFGSQYYFETDFVITSGSLYKVSNFHTIGCMNKKLFIDNIDLEWCFRAKNKGFEILGTDKAELYHSIGEQSENWLVKAGVMVQHLPSRYYYTSRNRIYLYGLKYSPIGWIFRDIIRFSIKSIWLLLVSKNRKEYMNNINSGIRDSRKLR